MGVKVKSHDVEKRGKNYFQVLIDNNDDTLFRELSGRDYGIDGIVEVFDKGIPTGKICYVQLKSTDEKIVPLKTFSDFVSCPGISESNLSYCKQDKIPIYLIYNSLKDKNSFYYYKLNGKEIIPDSRIRIPIVNRCEDDITSFLYEINSFYND